MMNCGTIKITIKYARVTLRIIKTNKQNKIKRMEELGSLIMFELGCGISLSPLCKHHSLYRVRNEKFN